jgi:hypothetical protein
LSVVAPASPRMLHLSTFFLTVLLRAEAKNELQQTACAPPNFTSFAFHAIKVLRLPAFEQPSFLHTHRLLHQPAFAPTSFYTRRVLILQASHGPHPLGHWAGRPNSRRV